MRVELRGAAARGTERAFARDSHRWCAAVIFALAIALFSALSRRYVPAGAILRSTPAPPEARR